MSRFYAAIEGSRGPASRQGTVNSGMWAHVRGWDVGVKVSCRVDAEGRDVIEVQRTGGSNDPSCHGTIATLTEGEL